MEFSHEFEVNGKILRFKLDDLLVGDYLFEQIIVQNEYFPTFISKECVGNIIDCGANVGLFTCLVAQLNPESIVWSFEPSNSNFKRLKHHIEMNSLTNVKAFNIGLGSTNRLDDLYMPHDEGAYSIFKENASLYTRGDGFTGKKEKIQIKKLSEFISNNSIDNVSYLKIDTEGCELEIIKDLADKFNIIDRIAVEYHPNVAAESLKNILIAAGYSLKYERIRFKNNDSKLPMGNIFGIK
jgi:FkbM family methyltransferase